MDPSSTKVETIVLAIGCLPLAISHAAGYMNESHSSLDDMLELYQGKHKMDAISWEHIPSDYQHKSVAATLISQLRDLDQHCPDARDLLRVIAFFDPESIRLDMLTTGAKAIVEAQEPRTRSLSTVSLRVLTLIQSPIGRQNAIPQLQNRCLVAYHAGPQAPTFCIHDLIQLVVLDDTKTSGLEQELFEFAVELACAAFRQIADPQLPESWPRCELLVPHIESLTLRQDTSIEAKKALLLANRHRGQYLGSRGRFVEAEHLYENITADREQLFGFEESETLIVKQGLAWIYQRRGRYVDAEALFQQVLESRTTLLGPERRDTLMMMYRFADVYIDQKRHEDAETLLKQTLQIQESRFGSEDKHALRTMYTLANLYREQRRYCEAESILTQVLQTEEKLLGSEHRDTFSTKHALAQVYVSLGRYDAAAALFEQVLHAVEKDTGSQYPTTLTSMQSLACIYFVQGRYGDAEKLLVHVLAARERVLGLSHRYTQKTIEVLSLVYGEQGRLDDIELKHRTAPS